MKPRILAAVIPIDCRKGSSFMPSGRPFTEPRTMLRPSRVRHTRPVAVNQRIRSMQVFLFFAPSNIAATPAIASSESAACHFSYVIIPQSPNRMRRSRKASEPLTPIRFSVYSGTATTPTKRPRPKPFELFPAVRGLFVLALRLVSYPKTVLLAPRHGALTSDVCIPASERQSGPSTFPTPAIHRPRQIRKTCFPAFWQSALP